MKQDEFQTFSNTIILKKYNEIFVCAKFNKKTKIVSDTLILIKLSDNRPIVLKTEKIGRLELKK